MQIIQGLTVAVSRFPLTVLCLTAAAGLICYMISLHHEPSIVIQKLMFTLLVGAFIGITAQFSCERFGFLGRLRLGVYGAAALVTMGYYLILWPVASISMAVTARTLVAVFAMFCAFLWVPSYRDRAYFNTLALTRFKSVFISNL